MEAQGPLAIAARALEYWLMRSFLIGLAVSTFFHFDFKSIDFTYTPMFWPTVLIVSILAAVFIAVRGFFRALWNDPI
jgi:hypothetical protein